MPKPDADEASPPPRSPPFQRLDYRRCVLCGSLPAVAANRCAAELNQQSLQRITSVWHA